MKVTVLLRNDHEGISALFDKYRKPNAARAQNGKRELFNEIRRELQIHSQMEQEIFYPALRTTSSARAVELMDEAEQEHQAMEQLLEELTTVNGSDPKQFDAKMAQLIDMVNEHIEKEEEEIFDEARKNLPEYRLEELGLEMEARRKILQTLAA
jgi:hemerythrin superfamily protein